MLAVVPAALSANVCTQEEGESFSSVTAELVLIDICEGFNDEYEKDKTITSYYQGNKSLRTTVTYFVYNKHTVCLNVGL